MNIKPVGDLTHIVAALKEDPATLAARMHIACDAVIVNQCDEDSRGEYEYEGHRIRVVNDSGRGVGRSRNQGMLLADTPITLIGDEDITYRDGYADAVLREFAGHPEADLLLFNVAQSEGRATYHNEDYARVRFYNCGRYPAYSIALRTDRQREANVWFSLLFGGGAKYMAGEDSLFLLDCLRRGLKIYRTPVALGEERKRESTWFAGYTDKFFRDRGALYRALYGRLAPVLALCYLYKNRREWLQRKNALPDAAEPEGSQAAAGAGQSRTFGDAWRLLREGMR